MTRKYVTESRRIGRKRWTRGRIVWEFPDRFGETAAEFAKAVFGFYRAYTKTQVRLRRVPDATPVSRQEVI